MVTDKILVEREKRNEEIKKLLLDSDVACLKVNVPGFDKNTPTSKLLFCYFTQLLKNKGLVNYKTLSGEDGSCGLYLINNGKSYKKKFLSIEENHPLGRFIDLDVTLKNSTSSLSRKKLRKCYICDKPAFYCGRTKAHTHAELLAHMEEKT